ncbi:MAG: hypothetical protein JNM07_06640 [Phycisphaerae bacterium]|nr:hypothetical protein [Phycisphaerae bacterium]
MSITEQNHPNAERQRSPSRHVRELGGVSPYNDLFQSLESRTLLAQASWDGGGDQSSWSDPFNWANDTLPANGDDVFIFSNQVNGSVKFTTGSVTLNTFTSSQNVDVQGGSLGVSGLFRWFAGRLTYSGGLLAGSPEIINSTLELAGGASPVTFIMSASTTLFGDVGTAQTLWLRGSNSAQHSDVAWNSGFTNRGTIRMEPIEQGWNETITLPGSNVLINEGAITAIRGAITTQFGGLRRLNANVTNRGSIAAAPDQEIEIANVGRTFRHESGSLSTGKGIIVFDGAGGGSLAGSMVFAGGTTVGAPTLVNVALSIQTASPGSFFVTGEGASLSGDVAAGQTVRVGGSGRFGHARLIVASGFTNAGTIRLETIDFDAANQPRQYRANLFVNSGTLLNTGVLELIEGTGGERNVSAQVHNTGVVLVDVSPPEVPTVLFGRSGAALQNSGSFTVSGVGAIVSIQGASFTNSGSLIVSERSTFSVAFAAFNFTGGVITGSVTLFSTALTLGASSGAGAILVGGSSTLAGDIRPDQTIWVQGGISGQTATLTSPSGFVNNGVLRLAPARGPFNCTLVLQSGVLVNNGTIDIPHGKIPDRDPVVGPAPFLGTRSISGNVTNRGMFRVGSARFDLLNAGRTFRQESGALEVLGRMIIWHGADGALAGGSFVLAGGTISGAPQLVNAALALQSSSPAAFILSGTSATITGAIAAGQTVHVRGGDDFGGAILTAANPGGDLTNAGVLRLESINSQQRSNLFAAGTITNTGSLILGAGSGGARDVSAAINNSGSVQVLSRGFNGGPFGRPGAAHVNTGSFVVSGEDGTNTAPTITVSGSSFTNAGQLTVDPGSFALVLTPSFTHAGGMSGSTTAIGTTLTLAAATPASFALGGASSLVGDIAVGQTVWVQGSSRAGTTTLTSTSGFTNAGTLRIEPIEQGFNCAVNVPAGTLTNTGSILVNRGDISATFPGLRTIIGNLTNRGALVVGANISLSVLNAGRTFTQEAGALNTGGGLTVTNGTLQLLGGIVTGKPLLLNGLLSLRSTSAASFILTGATATLSGPVSAGQSVWIRGSNLGGDAVVTSNGPLSNGGVIRMESIDAAWQSVLVVAGAFTNTGVVLSADSTGGARRLTVSAGDLINAGTFDLSSRAVVNVLAGRFIQLASGSLASAFASSSVYARVTAALSVELAGNVATTFVSGYAPTRYQRSGFITGASVAGFFGTQSAAAPAPDNRAVVVPSGTGAELLITSLADFNRDGAANGVDLALYTAAYNASDPAADFNEDGQVTETDLNLFNYYLNLG